MGKDIDGNGLLHNVKNSCLFKIIDKSEIGTIIVWNKMICKDVHHVKIHLNKLKINLHIMLPDIEYFFAIIRCYSKTGLPISSFTQYSIELKTLISLLHTLKIIWNRKSFFNKWIKYWR